MCKAVIFIYAKMYLGIPHC